MTAANRFVLYQQLPMFMESLFGGGSNVLFNFIMIDCMLQWKSGVSGI